MPHDTNTLSAGLGHAAQAHTNSQPPLNCSNTADTVTMNWMQQSSDLVQQNTARRVWIFKSFFLFCFWEFALKLRCSWESHPCHACSLCPVSVMATDIDNTEHCQYQTSLILHGKGIKFLYSKTSSVLRKKDKNTKTVPNIVFWKKLKKCFTKSQKL